MWLKRISILNYKNLEQAELSFSRKMNCIIGKNGMGKTNLLDAVYYLSFCKSATNPIDSQNIRHDQDFFVIQGFYETDTQEPEEVYCGLKRKQKKQFKRNKKEYTRLSDHIGFIPLVLVSPADSLLIAGGSEERRRFMDVVISQFDREYLEALIRYNKALMQRNTLLKSDIEPEEELMAVWEEMMATAGTVVYQKRKAFIDEFIPVFQSYYAYISQDREEVSLAYESHAAQGDLLQLIQESRQRDRIMGYSLKGVHKDDLVMQLGEFPIKREGSQGQNKTYLIALKLAQFEFLKRTGSQTTPLVLLDDIFDKLDASRVEQIVKLVAGDNFGQIFITDTNRDHLDKILKKIDGDYKLFEVEGGMVTERKEEAHEAE
ncbi:DNA replication/repair protein RecF [Phocaeicola barnesiae]|jgi:DNA replication and repair protein RecF|uniref:DNA replication/repair protein RecF n=1 Tax=Phocaeicola barnesiae TaxID=376804 RepID=UPI000334E957|nr:DNA replication and repair protein RecF [Phocaeicola barnesiae]MBS6467620.1 DNA replication and repair protein RecF [Bacteroides sp.]MDM8250282.1 DNA replication and repair protein RecF [Phocaeicola barnesiae]MDM8307651.1 DNA replication and repair protein RecF [Phocaeicola barnesiae]CDD33910.1 dNA replication and repair protein RecF [Bacteroides sp. CAG:714]